MWYNILLFIYELEGSNLDTNKQNTIYYMRTDWTTFLYSSKIKDFLFSCVLAYTIDCKWRGTFTVVVNKQNCWPLIGFTYLPRSRLCSSSEALLSVSLCEWNPSGFLCFASAAMRLILADMSSKVSMLYKYSCLMCPWLSFCFSVLVCLCFSSHLVW